MRKHISTTFILLVSFYGHAHERHHKKDHSQVQKKTELTSIAAAASEQIQSEYLKNVKPIFDRKCADCHSADVAAPWYASVPLVGGLVESDRSEAKEHIEISKGFPFAGHGTPAEDLMAIKESVEKDTMPTKLYRFMHPSSKLSEAERSTVLEWVKTSEQLLNED